ncbi:substrate-binding periplasmic protein [Paucibacter soli]|uniref:substrate-binding periplasmic protein n=1 Tax=Paucibacter soli TaxID=3133433 RepID=UPI0030A391AD
MADKPRTSLTPLALLLLLTGLRCGAAGAEPLTIYMDATPELIGSPDKGRTIVGPAADALRKIAQHAGLSIQLQLAPLARSSIEAATRPNTCVAGLAQDAQRLSDYKWAGPVSHSRQVIYARHDTSRRIASAQDLQGARIGVMRGSQPAGWLSEQGLNPLQLPYNQNGLQMLNSGRIDFWAVHELNAQVLIKRSDAPAPQLVYVIREVQTFLACHPQLPDETMARLTQGIAEVTRQGGLAFAGLK